MPAPQINTFRVGKEIRVAKHPTEGEAPRDGLFPLAQGQLGHLRREGVLALAEDKVMSLSEAIDRLVQDGDCLYLAGFTHLIPYAAGHEIIRQGRRNLTLCRATPDLIYDQMIAAGCAKKVVFSWAGNPGVGLLRCFRRKVQAGEIEIEEYTHFGMVARLFAGATNLPFFPLRSITGSDLPEHNPNIRTVTCPYTGQALSVVPALNPDVAIIHAQRADRHGNAHIWGIIGEQREAAFAARKVILTCEEIVSSEVIRSDPNRTLIPGFLVDAVVEEPWGAHPSYAQGYYDRDNDFYFEWDRISRSEEMVRAWLDEWVYGVSNRQEYLARLGAEKILQLRVSSHFSVPANFGSRR